MKPWLASQSSGHRRGLGVSIYVAGGRLGMAVGAGMATFIVTRLGFEWLPLAAALGLAVGIPVLFLAPPFADIGDKAPVSFSERDSNIWGARG